MRRAKAVPRWIELVERTSPRGWALVILPYEIRVDNFHGALHIHPPLGQGPMEPIAERPLAAVRERIRLHVEARGTVVYAELVEELR